MSYCSNCGTELKQSDKFCSKCGHNTQHPNEIKSNSVSPQTTQNKSTDNQKIKSVTIGLLVVGLLMPLLPLIGGIIIAGMGKKGSYLRTIGRNLAIWGVAYFFIYIIIIASITYSGEDYSNYTNNTNYSSTTPKETGEHTYITTGYYECTIYGSACATEVPVRGYTTPGAKISLIAPVEKNIYVDADGQITDSINMTLKLGTNLVRYRVIYPGGRKEIDTFDVILETL